MPEDDYIYFVPMFVEFRSRLRGDAPKTSNWFPVANSLLLCYEFATSSLQSRGVFVSILCLCGLLGSAKIPTNIKFLAEKLSCDARTLAKSLAELETKKLIQKERKIEKKEQTHTEQTEGEEKVVSADLKNSLKTNGHLSQFSLDECLRYVQICASRGEPVKNAKGLANHLYKTGDSDAFILATLHPEKREEAEREIYGEPRKFTDEPCAVCYASKMEVVEGRGARPCPNCKNERGQSTGKQPEGEQENE
jgi:DNA-binding transcriptional regulator YhcF (GntR family)